MSTLLLIDGHSQAYRAYYGVKAPLATSNGELTTAVFGFTRKLLSVLRDYKPECVIVAFDEGTTWRHEEFEAYKATRDNMPDDMPSQLERIRQLLGAFKIPIVTYPNFEADDVIGTLAVRAAEAGHNVLILTGDRDIFQLINKRIRVLYTPGGPRPKTTVYGNFEVRERYDLEPAEIVDLKALTGDNSDNIPGVPGVGDKTASKFLKQYGSIEGLYEHIDEISGPKTRQNLINAQEQVLRNRRLVTIRTDLDLNFDPDSCRVVDYDYQEVVTLFNQLEFHSMMRDLPQVEAVDAAGEQMALFGEPTTDAAGVAEMPEGYRLIQNEAALDELIEALNDVERISFDVETTSTDPIHAKLVGVGLAWGAGRAAYIPVAHREIAHREKDGEKDGEQEEQLPWGRVLEALRPIFGDASVAKLAHNGKYDLVVCHNHGLEIAGPIYDTMTMAWLLNPSSRQLSLKAQAAMELNWQMQEITDLIGTGRKQITMDQVPILEAGAYCCADTDVTLRIFDRLKPRLEAEEMWDLFVHIETPLLPVLADMEMAGVQLDEAYLGEMSERLTAQLGEIESEIFAIAGQSINLRSTKQLGDLLFETMNFPAKTVKKTSSGRYSTAVDQLEKLAESEALSEEQKRVIELILEYRQLEKLRGTYLDSLPALSDSQGRVHTSFNQTGTSTGRLSSSNPNLQNIPNRTALGREIRRGFVAREGWRLLAADYSQVELRILAHAAREEPLLEAFRNNQDPHATTASLLFDVPLGEVTYEQRTLGKTINFATVYGISAFGLSNRTNMDPKQARYFLDRYFETYPNIKRFLDETLKQAKEKGYVETLLGRRRFFPEFKRRLPFSQRQGIERAAINAPIQGTNADIIKIAMNRLHEKLRTMDAHMVLQVHDELVLELPPAEQDAVVQLVCDTMESAYALDVPLQVDVRVGANWYDMDEI